MIQPLLSLRRRWLEARAVRASGLFDAGHYVSQLRGRSDETDARKHPVQHYLRVGGFEGLDPGPEFDSDWYLAANPDVQALGLNPLVHYLRHGMAEGRLPYHGARPVEPFARPGTVARLNQLLWGGFEHRALPELRRRAEGQGERQAAWSMAAWDYAHGHVAGALDWLRQALANRRGGASGRDRISLAKCYTLPEDYASLDALLAEPGAAESLGPALAYVQANRCRDGAERLAVINRLFAAEHLVGVKRRDAQRPLALDNLEAAETPPAVAGWNLPLVSVVVAAYNAADTLPTALDSLLAQTWSALEVIVVDDGSTDGTAEVVRAYAARDDRVRYLANECNIGAYPSRNHGMRAARGDFVTVHDSDDWSHPQKLERQLQPLLENESMMASVSSWVRVTPDMRFVGSWMLGEHFLETNHSSWLIRRQVVETIGLWDAVNVAADTEFLWRMEHHYGHRALGQVLFDTPLSFALSDEGTLTRARATHAKTVFYGLRRLYRESSRWWHRASGGKPVMTERPFPVPLGNLKNPPVEFDALVAANGAVQGDALARLLELLRERAAGERLCLLHWPDYHAWLGRPIADEVFALCQQHGIHFAHPGLALSAPRVILADDALWQHPPSQTVQLRDLERVETADGSLCADQDALLDYFANGGV